MWAFEEGVGLELPSTPLTGAGNPAGSHEVLMLPAQIAMHEPDWHFLCSSIHLHQLLMHELQACMMALCMIEHDPTCSGMQAGGAQSGQANAHLSLVQAALQIPPMLWLLVHNWA